MLLNDFVFLGIHFQIVPFVCYPSGQMEETPTSNQDIPEEPGSVGSDMDEAHRFPNLHGLTSTIGKTALETLANKLLEQVEPKTVIALTEDQSFPIGQSPSVVLGTSFQCDVRSDPGSIQNRVPDAHRRMQGRMGSPRK